MSEKEERIRSIVSIYYSNPAVQKALFEFAQNREVVPRYFEGFGKRPDTFQYPGDVMAAVKKGATSFHASEEIWRDPLQLSSDFSPSELSELRKAWDMLIDVDSPFLDYSKIATTLLANALESHGVKSYAIKFSGSKGFHLIVPSEAFPKEFREQETKDMFPEWPRAICEYLMEFIKPEYNRAISDLGVNYKAIKERTNLSKEDITKIICPECGSKAEKTNLVTLKCNRCQNVQHRPSFKVTKRRLRCIELSCPGEYELESEAELYRCKACSYSSFDKTSFSTRNIATHTSEAKKSKYSQEFKEEVSGEALGSLDLVLVAPRHLFRMPYSLHEKTALASVVLSKEEIAGFTPKDANPLNVKIKSFYPVVKTPEARNLLSSALNWKKGREETQEKEIKKKYESMEFEAMDLSHIEEKDFPLPIKNLMKGLKDGRKRGLFVLLTFLRSIGYPPDKINETCRTWNKKNEQPLKEGYLKSQIDWHLKQKRRILPPNYSNQAFYKDLQLFETPPKEKNPLSEIMKKVKNRR
ncbi:hypothetical protein CO038_02595 [Candidatus Pacearchaeota archaeon CG_4_9_14_0_2_um_filter_39_13]|nr:hypothetical protein [Candidatus Pacearchaeota archaeon]OIO44123.1 MAG: hypothetical protein AUJ64_00700 [Candidatus Pacearchaeota archaeon CG1_02_39_14]PJC44673.1 MAG: hypothetical protein CO038_02595 [Candidatus Pacearchaeota archaeon CG_4_9_14_0_2_um_filter_39_13]